MKGTSTEVMDVSFPIEPDAHLAGTIEGDGVDTRAFDEIEFALRVGAIGTSVDMTVEESDDDGVNDPYTLVAGSAIAQITLSNRSARVRLDASKHKRFLRPVVVGVGTNDLAVAAIKSQPKYTDQITFDANELVDVN